MLRGRGAEQAAIDALLGEARKGASGALIIRGEPGIGKSALLDYADGQASTATSPAELRVLRGAGIESEAELPFAGLHLLLKPVLEHLPALPPPQQRALAGAFGLSGESSGGDRFMIGAGVLSLLADVAEATPLLCLVDDAQWLDRASAEALLFAARRLDREGIAVLFAARDYAGAFASSGIAELRLAGLPASAAAELVASSGASLPDAVRDQLVAETHGNPLALLELPAVLAEREGGAASVPAVAPLPLSSRVLDAFHHQVRSLPTPARTWLLVAAADDTGDLPVLLQASSALEVGVADLAPAEERGLVTLAGDVLAFRHPLIRAAVYQGAPLVQRVAAHQALAEAYGDADRRAWHLAAAAGGPSESVAEELELAAGRAASRTGFAAAAAAYDRAARLSQSAPAAARRSTLACEAGLNAGQLGWARSRAERLSDSVVDPELRLRLIAVRAGADFARGALSQAHALLVDGAALVAESDPERAFWMLLEAVHATWALPTDRSLMAETVDRLGALELGPDDPLRWLVWLVRWGTAVALSRPVADFPPLSEVLASARTAAAVAGPAGPRALLRVGTMAFATGRDDVGVEVASALVSAAREDGLIYALPGGLGHLALVQVLLGRHREAKVSGAEAVRIARDTGQPLWVSYASGALAYVSAIEGDSESCHQHAAAANVDASAQQSSAGVTWSLAALALLDLGAGRVREAYERLETIAAGATRHQGAVVRSVPDHVEAAVRLGLASSVVERVSAFSTWASTVRLPWIDALLERCLALTAPESSAEAHYVRALSLDDSRPFEYARTLLLYGEWLRRGRRKAEAREQLSLALKAFEDLGAAPWAARARAELGALGAAVPRTSSAPDVLSALTPQELQITQLAAQGLSNRDIAAQLFLSPRTVAYHLYKAYPKLGITSRGELAALLS
ncbi:ATP-binding protein [Flindersiella endophytica]